MANLWYHETLWLNGLWQIFNENLIQQLINQYDSGNIGRMIYFRENSNKLCPTLKMEDACCYTGSLLMGKVTYK